MKIIVIGDIHGLKTWKKIVENNTFDLCVFVGDYFDSYDTKAPAQIRNFNEIVKFKKKHGDKVVLLMGNHDFHYIFPGETYSGYNHIHAADIAEEISFGYRYLKKVHVVDKYLFAHAGVTKTWVAEHVTDTENISKGINDLSNSHFVFYSGDDSFCGNHISQGPLWVRPEALLSDKFGDYHQIVGHTKQQNINTIDNVTFVDCLWNGQYIVIENNQITVNTI